MNYYEQTTKQLEELIYDKKYDEALKIIDNELSMPYVPLDFENKLNEFKNKIINLNDTSTNNGIDENKLFELLSSSNLDKVEKIGLITELNKVNLRNHINDFDVIFSDDKFEDELKTILIYLIYGQQIDHDFKIKYKSLNDEYIVFNTLRTDLKDYEMVPLNIIKQLEQTLYNENIQLFEMAKQLTTGMYYSLFPLVKEMNTTNMKEAVLFALYDANGLEYKTNSNKEIDDYLTLLKKNGIA